MKIDSITVRAAEGYVSDYISGHLDKNFVFHDLSHTLSVVKAVEMICSGSGTHKYEKKILLVAAWFHDLGYTQRIDEHEDIGASLAEKFLKEQGITESEIQIVKSCIIATHFPQYPLTEGEKILCDADMIHLGDKNYLERAEVLRKEWANTRNKIYTDEEWLQLNIDFLSNHSYHTPYCRENFDDRKKKNIKKLVRLQQGGDNKLDRPERAKPFIFILKFPLTGCRIKR